MKLLLLVLAVEATNGLVLGAPLKLLSTGAGRGIAARWSPNLQMQALPATLQFSGYRGYFVVLSQGEEVEIPKERVGHGLVMGDRVIFDIEADMSAPLVTAMPVSDIVPAAAEAEDMNQAEDSTVLEAVIATAGTADPVPSINEQPPTAAPEISDVRGPSNRRGALAFLGFASVALLAANSVMESASTDAGSRERAARAAAARVEVAKAQGASVEAETMKRKQAAKEEVVRLEARRLARLEAEAAAKLEAVEKALAGAKSIKQSMAEQSAVENPAYFAYLNEGSGRL
jgi:hypothetical protein